MYSLRCKKRNVYVAADWETRTCFQELPVWIYAENYQKILCFPTPRSRLLLNSSRPENCTQAKTIPQDYEATSGEWVALTPDLQLLKSPPEIVLAELDKEEWDPETVSWGGASQTEALLNWAEIYHHQFRCQMAEQYLGQYSLSIIGGYQLQAGSSAQEFGAFLKTLDKAGHGTKRCGPT